MNDLILSKTAGNGMRIEVRLKEYLPGQHIAQIYLDGQYVNGESRPVKLSAAKGDVTHWLGRQGKAVGLTSAEAEQINAAIDAANAAYRASAAGEMQALRNQREDLVAAIQEWHAVFDRLEGAEAQTAAAQIEPRIRAAQDALRAFDAANPELAAERAAAKAERVARNQWM
jgi:hypothetical protein